MITVNIHITSSKIFAYLIVLIGTVAFFTGDTGGIILAIAIPTGAGLVANKQYQDRLKEQA